MDSSLRTESFFTCSPPSFNQRVCEEHAQIVALGGAGVPCAIDARAYTLTDTLVDWTLLQSAV
jgi:hypothetical protein